MSCNASASINAFSAGCAPEQTILEERECLWGRLDCITESGETIFADIEGYRVELPRSLLDAIEPLLGQRVIVGLFGGQYRAGRCSA